MPKNKLNAKSSVINLANILDSSDSKIRQVGVALLFNRYTNIPGVQELEDSSVNKDSQKPKKIRITLGGDILFDGMKLDKDNIPAGYIVFSDKKEARSTN